MKFRPARSLVAVLAAFIAVLSVQAQGIPPSNAVLTRIAFGSCAKEDRPQPIWDAIVAQKPELFLFIGDNIYADTEDMQVMRTKYGLLAAQPGFQALRATCPVLATWDDHDYGKNDAGVEYSQKVASQKEFLQFFREPADSPRWKRPGVYHSYVFGPRGKRVQVILLDTRYFRSALKKAPANTGSGPYMANTDPTSTVLGEAQWKWFEQQLRQPADLRIIASSIQLIPEEHHYELWANFPHERKRFFDVLRRTKANGVVIISGDRHMAEISRLDPSDPNGIGYPVFDITASSLNRGGKGNPGEINKHRVSEGIYGPANFGVITVGWDRKDPEVQMRIHDEAGKIVFESAVPLGMLKRR